MDRSSLHTSSPMPSNYQKGSKDDRFSRYRNGGEAGSGDPTVNREQPHNLEAEEGLLNRWRSRGPDLLYRVTHHGGIFFQEFA